MLFAGVDNVADLCTAGNDELDDTADTRFTGALSTEEFLRSFTAFLLDSE